MKLVYAIVRKEDGNAVIEDLTQHGFSVTKMSTSGGFLRSGNTTLIRRSRRRLYELSRYSRRRRSHYFRPQRRPL